MSGLDWGPVLYCPLNSPFQVGSRMDVNFVVFAMFIDNMGSVKLITESEGNVYANVCKSGVMRSTYD